MAQAQSPTNPAKPIAVPSAVRRREIKEKKKGSGRSQTASRLARRLKPSTAMSASWLSPTKSMHSLYPLSPLTWVKLGHRDRYTSRQFTILIVLPMAAPTPISEDYANGLTPRTLAISGSLQSCPPQILLLPTW